MTDSDGTDYEIIGVTRPGVPDGDVGEVVGGEPSGGRPWLVAVPVLLVALVVGVMARGGSESVEEPPSPEILDRAAETTLPDDEGVVSFPDAVEEARSEEALLASFGHLHLLAGTPDQPVVAKSLDGESEVELPLTGAPIAYVEPWLILHRTGEIVAVDLSQNEPEPVVLMEIGGIPDQIIALSDKDSLWLSSGFRDLPDDSITRYEVGSWRNLGEEPLARFYIQGAPGLRSIAGTGVFGENDDGVQRLGDGYLLGFNLEIAVVRDCEGFSDCEIVVYRRDGWVPEATFDASLMPSDSYVQVARDAPLALAQNYSDSVRLIDLETGRSVEISDRNQAWFGPPLAVSDVAVLLPKDDHLAVADRASGETYLVPVSYAGSGPTVYSAVGPVLVDTGQSVLVAARENADG